ncbi:MAG: endonuclease/exonuclease/phosphatase family protein [Clostridia bacterium]|nr:endonuclease/exonuclease/phosphatase family protein [Clostridia bacterium]
MKIMSFNTQHCLNFIKRNIDFQVMADAITACNADVVGLNEMRGEGVAADYAAQTENLSQLTGLDHFFFAKAIEFPNGPYGNSLLSRYPIVSAEAIPVPDPEPRKYNGYYETRCLLKAKLENGLCVLVIHFGLNPDEQENAVHTILQHLENEKCILMGDFNVTPENELLRPIRERMKDTADFFAEDKLSFPSDRPDRKIDYIFVSPDIEVVTADIPDIVASDHRPHTAQINVL